MTQCIKLPQQGVRRFCESFYNFTSLPNLLGMTTVNQVMKILHEIQVGQALLKSIGGESAQTNSLFCHQHVDEIICHIFLPQCDKETSQVTHLCKEMCLEVLEACFDSVIAVYKKMLSISRTIPFRRDLLQFGNRKDEAFSLCERLPSNQDNISCFHKPVVCSSPLNIPNAKVKGSNTKKSATLDNTTFPLNFTFDYQCVHESASTRGDNKITCLYTGEWSKPPPCQTFTQNPLLVVMATLLSPSAVFLAVLYIWKCMQSPSPSRNREYDAFVCYHFDTNHPFVTETLKPQLEDKFKLLDYNNFKLGTLITENIEEAVKKSNSTIILLSQGFLDSSWCRYEFEYCCIESQNDPAFQILVILMQPLESLDNLHVYGAARIRNFIVNRSCLDVNDKKMWTKIGSHLTGAKSAKERRPCCLGQENDDQPPEETEMLPV